MKWFIAFLAVYTAVFAANKYYFFELESPVWITFFTSGVMYMFGNAEGTFKGSRMVLDRLEKLANDDKNE